MLCHPLSSKGIKVCQVLLNWHSWLALFAIFRALLHRYSCPKKSQCLYEDYCHLLERSRCPVPKSMRAGSPGTWQSQEGMEIYFFVNMSSITSGWSSSNSWRSYQFSQISQCCFLCFTHTSSQFTYRHQVCFFLLESSICIAFWLVHF